MRKNHFFYLIIILLTLLAYSNSFENSFHYDDVHVIITNAFIKDPGKIPQFFLQPQMGSGMIHETSSYRPLLMATFALNYYLDGLNVFGYHLVNFGLHILCALLVYFIILTSFRFINIPTEIHPIRYELIALFGALIFALHPVQTESVTYITGRSSLLSGLFFLGSFLAYLKYRLTQKVPYLGFSSLSYASALLTKETAITLLLILILFNLAFPHGDTFKKRFFSLLPYFLLSLIYLILRVYFLGFLQYGSRPVRPFYDNLLSQSRAWVHYLGTLILPLNLNVDYDFRVSHSILESQVILSIFLLVAISLLIWRLSRSNRLVGFFALWFAITLLPTNSVIALEDLVTDRWLYLSSVGYAVLLALTVDWVFQKWVEQGRRAGKIVFFFLCVLVIELYGSSTFLRNFTWANQRTLWEDAAAKSPHKARPYNSLGIALIFEGRLEEASQSLNRAITLAPQEGQAYINLGSVYMRQGKMEKALDIFQKAIPLNPLLLSDIYNNLGLIYFTLGRMEEGERASQKSIEIRPHHAAPYYNLGVYHEKKGDIDQAIYYYEIAAKLSPDYTLCHEALSQLYERKGWKEKSQKAYRNYLRYSLRK